MMESKDSQWPDLPSYVRNLGHVVGSLPVKTRIGPREFVVTIRRSALPEDRAYGTHIIGQDEHGQWWGCGQGHYDLDLDGALLDMCERSGYAAEARERAELWTKRDAAVGQVADEMHANAPAIDAALQRAADRVAEAAGLNDLLRGGRAD
jgi:hypothetical protein